MEVLAGDVGVEDKETMPLEDKDDDDEDTFDLVTFWPICDTALHNEPKALFSGELVSLDLLDEEAEEDICRF